MRGMLRAICHLLTALALVGAFASAAHAKAVPWEGTMVLELGPLPPVTTFGTGVATVNGSAGSDHLSTLRLAGGIQAVSQVVPVTDPQVTSAIKSVLVNATMGTGTISGIAASLGSITGNRTFPIVGTAKVCLFGVPGCGLSLDIVLSETVGGAAGGVGVGGLATLGGAGAIRISVQNAPWSIGPGMAVDQTANQAFTTITYTGFVHGAMSGTSSTVAKSGVIQLVSPMQVVTIGVPGSSEKVALFSTLTLHFVPEPGLLLLIGSGVAGLLLIGRSRMR